MKIGGFQKFSLIDYPGKICAIIFTQGCNFRCPYCHNPELVKPELFNAPIPQTEIFSFLKTRRGKLDAVEITGGEPTEHPGLPKMIRKIKSMGFLIKLDTNGSKPEMLKELINKKLIDYIAMDIKAPLKKYPKVAGRPIPVEKIKKSIDLIMNSGINYEFRTTIVKSLITKDDLKKIAETIKGAKNYYLQKFIPTKLYDPSFAKEGSYSDEELKALAKELEKYVEKCAVR